MSRDVLEPIFIIKNNALSFIQQTGVRRRKKLSFNNSGLELARPSVESSNAIFDVLEDWEAQLKDSDPHTIEALRDSFGGPEL